MVITVSSGSRNFKQFETLPQREQKQLQLLREFLKSLNGVCVAYSGGVDSTLVAAIAKEQLGSRAKAITGVSPALASPLLQEAKDQANWIGIEHKECFTQEILDPAYYLNPRNRCFACKSELHGHLAAIARENNHAQLIDGLNFDDLNEYRPGIYAAQLAGVISPLAELKISKLAIRQISKSLGFPWWDKPAQPCLASRFPYGEKINRKRLNEVEKAEIYIKGLGFTEVRVRAYPGKAMIEVPKKQIDKLIKESRKESFKNIFLSLNFESVEIDMEGLISGKLNKIS